jgi:hypothetical protein
MQSVSVGVGVGVGRREWLRVAALGGECLCLRLRLCCDLHHLHVACCMLHVVGVRGGEGGYN